MSNQVRDGLPHIIVDDRGEAAGFRSPRTPRDKPYAPVQNRPEHARRLREQLDRVESAMARAVGAQREAGLDSGLGLAIYFSSKRGLPLDVEKLDRPGAGIELLSAPTARSPDRAAVFVPDGRLSELGRLVREYADPERDGK